MASNNPFPKSKDNPSYLHGKSGTHEHFVWKGINQRCNDTNNPKYGGRGIRVCQRWMDFANFFADMGECPEGFSIERIDNDGDYSPENCKWATVKEQANNRRTSNLVTYQGRTQTLTAWCGDLNLPISTIESRIKRGWTPEKAFTKPIGKNAKGIQVTYKGKTQNLSQWATELDVNVRKLIWRINKGWPVERAFTT